MLRLAALLLCVLLPAGAARADCALRMAWTPWEPFFISTPDGPAGIDHDLAVEAARRVGCAVIWQEMPWVRAIAMMKSGLVDALVGVQPTQERGALGRLVGPLRGGRNVLYVRRGEAARWPLASLSDIPGTRFRLGIQRGSRYSQEYETLLASGRLAPNLMEANGSAGGLTMLARGRVDGFLEGETVGTHLARRLGLTDQLEIHPMPVSASDAFMLLSTTTVPPDRADRLQQALDAMRADGTVERIKAQAR
ncbi:MAG TPA: transporter substrate-binding domain-containing protein [Azospirillaceae bacterium]|nr:transporter substrate-binding domain-containing protein [Azospirillaceae bacterium]